MTGSWLPAALSADLPEGVVMPMRSPDGPLALWRGRSGKAAACADRCPHRGMRLSHAFVRGDTLRCIYHGWSYAASGACLGIPAHPELTPPDAIRVRTWQVAEAGGLVWIGLGDPEEPPPTYAGLVPLRTLDARAGPAALAACAGESEGSTGLLLGGPPDKPAFALLFPQGEGRTVIHVLVDEASTTAERVAASRWSEALRRSAEAREQDRGLR